MKTGLNERELRELAFSAGAGDRRAFRRLYEETVGRVHAQVGRLLGRGPMSDDVVQDVFLEVFKSLPHYRGEAWFATWLFRVTHNVAVSHLRRRSSRPVELAPIKELAAAAHQPDFDARRQVRALYAALDQVPTESREAFVLYEIEGLSLRSIAEVTEQPLNTIASRVRRTRERLRRLLEREPRAGRKAR